MSKKEDLLKTPWLPSKVDPARPGLYEVKYRFFTAEVWVGWSWWDGKRWGSRNTTKNASIECRTIPAHGPIDFWRGLAKNPKLTKTNPQ